MGRGIPDRWQEYSPMGVVIPGTRLIAFKVPLKEALLSKMPPRERFTIQILLDKIPELGLVIDLTMTTRYYNKHDFLNQGVSYSKIACPGQQLPDNSLVKRFFAVVDTYLENHKHDDTLIGVHCTHGVNRTGYMLGRYLVQRMGLSVAEAIEKVSNARGHRIERPPYLSSLHRCCDGLPSNTRSLEIEPGRKQTFDSGSRQRSPPAARDDWRDKGFSSKTIGYKEEKVRPSRGKDFGKYDNSIADSIRNDLISEKQYTSQGKRFSGRDPDWAGQPDHVAPFSEESGRPPKRTHGDSEYPHGQFPKQRISTRRDEPPAHLEPQSRLPPPMEMSQVGVERPRSSRGELSRRMESSKTTRPKESPRDHSQFREKFHEMGNFSPPSKGGEFYGPTSHSSYNRSNRYEEKESGDHGRVKENFRGRDDHRGYEKSSVADNGRGVHHGGFEAHGRHEKPDKKMPEDNWMKEQFMPTIRTPREEYPRGPYEAEAHLPDQNRRDRGFHGSGNREYTPLQKEERLYGDPEGKPKGKFYQDREEPQFIPSERARRPPVEERGYSERGPHRSRDDRNLPIPDNSFLDRNADVGRGRIEKGRELGTMLDTDMRTERHLNVDREVKRKLDDRDRDYRGNFNDRYLVEMYPQIQENIPDNHRFQSPLPQKGRREERDVEYRSGKPTDQREFVDHGERPPRHIHEFAEPGYGSANFQLVNDRRSLETFKMEIPPRRETFLPVKGRDRIHARSPSPASSSFRGAPVHSARPISDTAVYNSSGGPVISHHPSDPHFREQIVDYPPAPMHEPQYPVGFPYEERRMLHQEKISPKKFEAIPREMPVPIERERYKSPEVKSSKRSRSDRKKDERIPKRSRSPRLRSRSPRPRTRSPRPRSRSPLPRTRSPLPRTRSPLPRTRSPLPRTRSPLPRTRSPLPRTRSPLPRTRSPLPRTRSPLPRTRSPLPRTRSPRPRARTPRRRSRSLRRRSRSPRLMPKDIKRPREDLHLRSPNRMDRRPEFPGMDRPRRSVTPPLPADPHFIEPDCRELINQKRFSTVPDEPFVEGPARPRMDWHGPEDSRGPRERGGRRRRPSFGSKKPIFNRLDESRRDPGWRR